MDLSLRKEFLYKVNLFRGLREVDVLYIAKNVIEKTYPVGEYIFMEGDEASSMYIIVSGEISIQKGQREIARLGSGTYIGEMAILDSGTRSASAQVINKVFLLEISEELFHQTVGQKSNSLLSILKTLSRRIREDNRRLENDYLQLASLVHDLRNSLSSLTYASLIQDSYPNDSDTIEWTNHILATQRYMFNTMNNVLFASQKSIENYSFDENHILETMNETIHTHMSLHPQVKEHQLELICKEPLLLCPHNKNDIIRVLCNLIINACQASEPSSEIKISLYNEQDFVVIEISDKGKGIPVQLQDLIFYPRFTNKKDGNGLGLSTSKTIIEKKHNGSLDFVSKENQGTTFKIMLPKKSES